MSGGNFDIFYMSLLEVQRSELMVRISGRWTRDGGFCGVGLLEHPTILPGLPPSKSSCRQTGEHSHYSRMTREPLTLAT